MFEYLRYFSVISFVLVIVIAITVGILFKNIASEDLHAIVMKNNKALSQGFVNVVWKRHRHVLNRLSRYPLTAWKNDVEFIAFSQEAFHYFEEMPIAKMSIYLPNGALLFTSDQSKILYTDGKQGEEEGAFGFDKILEGDIASRILPNSGFRTASGQLKQGVLIQTILPIRPDNYVEIVTNQDAVPIEGAVEIFFDVTNQWEQLYIFQLVASGGIVIIFLVLISVITFTSRRAEAIIAKQHEINLELTAAAATAEAENRDKSQFLANISHELRTPLNAIIGFSEIIKSEVAESLNPTHRDYIFDIHGSGVHLLSLINDILDYSKAEAGKLDLELEEIDICKAIKNSMRLVIPRAESAQVMLVEDLPADHIIMTTDEKKLKQVLLNLLSNAVKFTPAGGEIKVSAWGNILDQSVSIQVSDTGIGIAPKDISRVMTPFGQVDSTLARKYEGTGLGLPLSKKFIEIMGGQFQIESEVNKGTKVTITLPREAPKKRRR